MKTVKRLEISYLTYAAALIVIGAVLAVFPGVSLGIVGVAAGIVLALVGALCLILHFGGMYFGIPSGFTLMTGIAFLMVGILLIIRPGSGASVVTFIIGAFVAVEGVFRIQNASEERRAGLRRWWLPLIAGIADIIFGLMTIIRPFGTASAIVRLAGIALIIVGVTDAAVSLYASRHVKKRVDGGKKDTIYYIGD
ncbi:MAG: DUF308 domain-containing protein [Clostridiales bacterium]|nr:DUF308 domain-containing protein [Clostridiales bacterium]